MIKIGDKVVTPSTLRTEQQWTDVQLEIIGRMAASPIVFSYPDTGHFRFELTLRNHIVGAAGALNYSGVSFATFKESRCNEELWRLTDFGGFRIRENVRPSDGIRDIYRNGRKYAFECATAMVIVYYRAVLASIDEGAFNRLFADMLLYDWHYDKDLGLTTIEETVHLPGDVVYFKNPDVNPDTPEWQGENAVVMREGLYYGHGIGIVGAREIIRHLNNERRPGAVRSAFMMEGAARPDFAYLYRFRPGAPAGMTPIRRSRYDRIIARIGSAYYEIG
ncbi:protein-glutamine gamma-glutamyltransferase [Brevibacillus sp. H7]|jgi:protein-glutamine gamma-glutamyltransferase|uniref:protein-glutamine gamma-glutamyltransferase n=1 Tax=Brevibacillus sp. H7 TaxID=3349138 RepID=UPI0037F5A9EC